MSELQQYYDAFSARLQRGEGLSPDECRCNGGGWILSAVDTWHKCPDHYKGQSHPEDDIMDHVTDEDGITTSRALLPVADLVRLSPEEVFGEEIPF